MTLKERRYSLRRAVDLPVRFRILRESSELNKMMLSGILEAKICDLGPRGLGITSPHITVDGIHIDHLEAGQPKPTVFLQWALPGGHTINATAHTVWCEQFGSQNSKLFHIGLRFATLSEEAEQAVKQFLEDQIFNN